MATTIAVLDNFGIPSQKTEAEVIKGIIEVLNTLKCDAGRYNEMLAFFSDTSNYPFIITAFKERNNKYPAKNRPSNRPCWLCKWQDFCDWQDIWKLYSYAKICKKYPELEKNKKNCHVLKPALVALEAEKGNQITLFGLNSIEVEAVIKKISEYNSLYSMLACDDFFIDEQKMQSEKASKEKLDQSFERQIKANEIVTGDDDNEGNTKKYITYGAVGLAAVAFLVVLIKKVNK